MRIMQDSEKRRVILTGWELKKIIQAIDGKLSEYEKSLSSDEMMMVSLVKLDIENFEGIKKNLEAVRLR